MEGGQNPGEGPGPGFRRLPGLEQLRRARARPAAPAARHARPQRALERLRPGARAGPGAQGGRQRAGAQTRAGQAGGGRRGQRRGAVGRGAARGLLGVVVLGRAARLALFGARRARRTLGAGRTLLFAELGPAVLEPDLRAQGPVRPRPRDAREPSVWKGSDQDYYQIPERGPVGPPLPGSWPSSLCSRPLLHLPLPPGLPLGDLITRHRQAPVFQVSGRGLRLRSLITQSPAPNSFLLEAPGISTWSVPRRWRRGRVLGETVRPGSPVRADQLDISTWICKTDNRVHLGGRSSALRLPRALGFQAQRSHSCRAGEGTWRHSMAFWDSPALALRPPGAPTLPTWEASRLPKHPSTCLAVLREQRGNPGG